MPSQVEDATPGLSFIIKCLIHSKLPVTVGIGLCLKKKNTDCEFSGGNLN